MSNKRDRITFDLQGLRERLEAQAVEPGQSLSSILRRVSLLGLELLEVSRSLGISPPNPGEVREWLMQREVAQLQVIDNLLAQSNSEDLAKQAGIPVERIDEIKKGKRPTPDELIGLARALGRKPDELRVLLNRERTTNGC